MGNHNFGVIGESRIRKSKKKISGSNGEKLRVKKIFKIGA
jgi:hypothetical protein